MTFWHNTGLSSLVYSEQAVFRYKVWFGYWRKFMQEELIEPCVMGTRKVLNACREVGVKKVVFVSSVGAIMLNPNWPKDQPMDEDCWSDEEFCSKRNVRIANSCIVIFRKAIVFELWSHWEIFISSIPFLFLFFCLIKVGIFPLMIELVLPWQSHSRAWDSGVFKDKWAQNCIDLSICYYWAYATTHIELKQHATTWIFERYLLCSSFSLLLFLFLKFVHPFFFLLNGQVPTFLFPSPFLHHVNQAIFVSLIFVQLLIHMNVSLLSNHTILIIEVWTSGGSEPVKDMSLCLVDVRDLAEALMLAYEKPEVEGRYICSSYIYKVHKLVDKLKHFYPQYNYPDRYYACEVQLFCFSIPLPVLSCCDLSLILYPSIVIVSERTTYTGW